MPDLVAIRRALLGRGGILRRLASEVREDRVLGLAAETAFFTVLSMFPSLLVATGLLSLVDDLAGADVAGRTEDRITSALDLILTDRASGTVASVERIFEGSYGGLLTFATVGALVTLSGAWAVLIDALNQAYDTVERRSWLRRRALGLGLGVLTVLVVVVALTVIVVGPLLGKGEDLAALVGLGEVFATGWDLARFPLLLVIVTLWLMLVFHVAPNRRTRWRDSLPGAVSTALTWLLATAGFSFYLHVVGTQNPVLGAFGGGAIVMLWVYLLSIALMLGAEINTIIEERRTGARAADSGNGLPPGTTGT
jgi:membrane protein